MTNLHIKTDDPFWCSAAVGYLQSVGEPIGLCIETTNPWVALLKSGCLAEPAPDSLKIEYPLSVDRQKTLARLQQTRVQREVFELHGIRLPEVENVDTLEIKSLVEIHLLSEIGLVGKAAYVGGKARPVGVRDVLYRADDHLVLAEAVAAALPDGSSVAKLEGSPQDEINQITSGPFSIVLDFDDPLTIFVRALYSNYDSLPKCPLLFRVGQLSEIAPINKCKLMWWPASFTIAQGASPENIAGAARVWAERRANGFDYFTYLRKTLNEQKGV